MAGMSDNAAAVSIISDSSEVASVSSAANVADGNSFALNEYHREWLELKVSDVIGRAKKQTDGSTIEVKSIIKKEKIDAQQVNPSDLKIMGYIITRDCKRMYAVSEDFYPWGMIIKSGIFYEGGIISVSYDDKGDIYWLRDEWSFMIRIAKNGDIIGFDSDGCILRSSVESLCINGFGLSVREEEILTKED